MTNLEITNEELGSMTPEEYATVKRVLEDLGLWDTDEANAELTHRANRAARAILRIVRRRI